MLKPRNFPGSEKPGAYRIASKIGETTINKGESIDIAQFITGYGEIQSAKIQAYISSDIFDGERSTVRHSLKKIEAPEGLPIQWGSNEDQIYESDFRIMIHGIQFGNDTRGTAFVDADSGKNTFLITESRFGEHAPFEYHLTTKKDIKPGAHNIKFYLTYYNGSEWCCTEEIIQFKINNAFEKFNSQLSFLAATALIIAIYKDGALPALRWIYKTTKVIMGS